MLQTLVLNPTFEPISVFPLRTITWQAAVSRVLCETCNVVSEYEEYIKTSGTLVMKKPAVIVRKNFSAYRSKRGYSFKQGIYYRDSCVCQYCGTPLALMAMTMDHVIPESKGGSNSPENLVSSCMDCNSRKGADIWKPLKKPTNPEYREMVKIRKKFPLKVPTPLWAPFLEPWEGGIIVKPKHSAGVA